LGCALVGIAEPLLPAPVTGHMSRRNGMGNSIVSDGVRGVMLRRMIGRRASPFLASILLLAQLVAGPLTHAEPIMPIGGDCGPVAAASHTATDAMAGCADCPDERSSARSGSHPDGHHCRAHAACSCPCAHTPALAATRMLVLKPSAPDAVDGVLTAGTFDPPLFDFLRPPN